MLVAHVICMLYEGCNTGKSISVINKKRFGLKCLCAIFFGCNEDISVNI